MIPGHLGIRKKATLSVTSLRAPPATNQGSLGRRWPLANWETIGKTIGTCENHRNSHGNIPINGDLYIAGKIIGKCAINGVSSHG